MNPRAIKKTALERAKARYPNSQRKAHYEFIRLWEAECKKKYAASLLTQRNGEGTLASVFCRDYCQPFIDKRGGITYCDKKRTKKVFEGYSLLQAVLDQR